MNQGFEISTIELAIIGVNRAIGEEEALLSDGRHQTTAQCISRDS